MWVKPLLFIPKLKDPAGTAVPGPPSHLATFSIVRATRCQHGAAWAACQPAVPAVRSLLALGRRCPQLLGFSRRVLNSLLAATAVSGQVGVSVPQQTPASPLG